MGNVMCGMEKSRADRAEILRILNNGILLERVNSRGDRLDYLEQEREGLDQFEDAYQYLESPYQSFQSIDSLPHRLEGLDENGGFMEPMRNTKACTLPPVSSVACHDPSYEASLSESWRRRRSASASRETGASLNDVSRAGESGSISGQASGRKFINFLKGNFGQKRTKSVTKLERQKSTQDPEYFVNYDKNKSYGALPTAHCSIANKSPALYHQRRQSECIPPNRRPLSISQYPPIFDMQTSCSAVFSTPPLSQRLPDFPPDHDPDSAFCTLPRQQQNSSRSSKNINNNNNNNIQKSSRPSWLSPRIKPRETYHTPLGPPTLSTPQLQQKHCQAAMYSPRQQRGPSSEKLKRRWAAVWNWRKKSTSSDIFVDDEISEYSQGVPITPSVLTSCVAMPQSNRGSHHPKAAMYRSDECLLNAGSPEAPCTLVGAPGEGGPLIKLDPTATVRAVHPSLMGGRRYCFQVSRPVLDSHSSKLEDELSLNSGPGGMEPTPPSLHYVTRYYAAQSAAERNRWIRALKRTAKPNLENERHRENSLRLWVQEAKTVPTKKRYFCEILLNRVLYARTTSKRMLDMLFWGEEFHLNNLPQLTSITVQLWREADPKKKRDQNQFIGFVTIPISELMERSEVENWHPILPPSHQHVYQQSLSTLASSSSAHNLPDFALNQHSSGSKTALASQSSHHLSQLANGSVGDSNTSGFPLIRIKGRYQSVEVLPLGGYSELADLLTKHSVELMTRLEGTMGVKAKEDLAVSMVTLHEKLGTARQFLTDLVVQEVIRLDNDNMAFRGNSLATKSMESYMKLVGEKYLHDTLADFVQTVMNGDEECEVDPLKLSHPSQLERNQENLNMFVDMVWAKIVTSSVYFPRELRQVFASIRSQISRQPNRSAQLADHMTSACIFLRYICPAILSPSLFGLTQKFPEDRRVIRNFTLVAKTIQSLANFSPFGVKEGYMAFMNRFVQQQTDTMHHFLLRISTLNPPAAGLHGSTSFHPGTVSGHAAGSHNVRPSASLGYLNQMSGADCEEDLGGPSSHSDDFIDLPFELANLHLHLKDAIATLSDEKLGQNLIRLRNILKTVDHRLKHGFNPPTAMPNQQQPQQQTLANQSRRTERVARQPHQHRPNRGVPAPNFPPPPPPTSIPLSQPAVSMESRTRNQPSTMAQQNGRPAMVTNNNNNNNPHKMGTTMMGVNHPYNVRPMPNYQRPAPGQIEGCLAPIATDEDSPSPTSPHGRYEEVDFPSANQGPQRYPIVRQNTTDSDWHHPIIGSTAITTSSAMPTSHQPPSLPSSPRSSHRSPPLHPAPLTATSHQPHEEMMGTVSSSGYHSQASPPLLPAAITHHAPPVTSQPVPITSQHQVTFYQDNPIYTSGPHLNTSLPSSPVYSEVPQARSPPQMTTLAHHEASRSRSSSSSSSRSGSFSSSSYTSSSSRSSSASSRGTSTHDSPRSHGNNNHSDYGIGGGVNVDSMPLNRSMRGASVPNEIGGHGSAAMASTRDTNTLAGVHHSGRKAKVSNAIQTRPLPNPPPEEEQISRPNDLPKTQRAQLQQQSSTETDNSSNQYEREIQYLRGQLQLVHSRLHDTQNRLVSNEREKVRLLEEWQTRTAVTPETPPPLPLVLQPGGPNQIVPVATIAPYSSESYTEDPQHHAEEHLYSQYQNDQHQQQLPSSSVSLTPVIASKRHHQNVQQQSPQQPLIDANQNVSIRPQSTSVRHSHRHHRHHHRQKQQNQAAEELNVQHTSTNQDLPVLTNENRTQPKRSNTIDSSTSTGCQANATDSAKAHHHRHHKRHRHRKQAPTNGVPLTVINNQVEVLAKDEVVQGMPTFDYNGGVQDVTETV